MVKIQWTLFTTTPFFRNILTVTKFAVIKSTYFDRISHFMPIKWCYKDLPLYRGLTVTKNLYKNNDNNIDYNENNNNNNNDINSNNNDNNNNNKDMNYNYNVLR